jgi:hypothetical protein
MFTSVPKINHTEKLVNARLFCFALKANEFALRASEQRTAGR